MTKLKIAVIGYGGMGSYHANTILAKEKDLFEVVGIYDIDSNRQAHAIQDGLPVYENLEEVLKDSNVDALLIATPNDSHKELAIRGMEAGKHIVCEKPAVMNPQEFHEIQKVIERTGRTFMVHQNRRWDPDFLILKELYENKEIGEIFQIESRVHGANGIPGDWRHKKEHGGGMLLDWGVHLFDQLLWMIDSPIKKIETDLSFVLGNEVDDGFFSYITFENNMKVLVEVGTTNYTKLDRWYIKGTKGTAKISDWDLTGEMVVSKETQSVVHPTPIKAGVGLTKTMAPPSEEATTKKKLPKGHEMNQSFYQNFYHVVKNEEEPLVKNEEVLHVLTLMDNILTR
ncbi:scyllo-inositol 2-dehydrogenase (NADP+) [Aequitasia blattaphilus]|uniref:Gfo/Idh/MocA family oxidoreductase n=1 Tax=Aequitasia blattaphilus TaxID=2949332 RepID=A0ABT1E8Y6_9FIRM|nr:Gfo/Idh/MocA family oxidoreductase [Aequitasia blattaphilus]MCP1102084.1 Gfo/Idh/MocA family oxidoreductase [Aequitasia blattaphilus]MCR8614724.1 Gfo/Idh/MocA family oxidoreductase [Aequitasia blattaphilus]